MVTPTCFVSFVPKTIILMSFEIKYEMEYSQMQLAVQKLKIYFYFLINKQRSCSSSVLFCRTQNKLSTNLKKSLKCRSFMLFVKKLQNQIKIQNKRGKTRGK